MFLKTKAGVSYQYAEPIEKCYRCGVSHRDLVLFKNHDGTEVKLCRDKERCSFWLIEMVNRKAFGDGYAG